MNEAAQFRAVSQCRAELEAGESLVLAATRAARQHGVDPAAVAQAAVVARSACFRARQIGVNAGLARKE